MPRKISNSFAIITLFTMLSMAGLVLVSRLPLQLYPSYTSSGIKVSFGYAGASPATIGQRAAPTLEMPLSLMAGRKVRVPFLEINATIFYLGSKM
jgi:multidrug efflux pump subunit AcrB